jgi:hypothetical protein
MPTTQEHIRKLSRDLYPGGRAFKMPIDGILDQLHEALAESEGQAFNDALAIMDSLFADNPNFTTGDAEIWEGRLGLISNPLTPLVDRMAAINQKLNYPGTTAPRQHFQFIEDELNAAGFAVKVYENNFGGVTQSPEQILGTSLGASFHATTIQHATTQQHGGLYSNKVANYIEESKDAQFVIGGNYRSTFYISGTPITTFADILATRKDEFRQLILKLKPAQTMAFLFVNYI